jgi:hypothetical protein
LPAQWRKPQSRRQRLRLARTVLERLNSTRVRQLLQSRRQARIPLARRNRTRVRGVQ